AKVRPRFAGVGGFVDAVAGGEVGTLQPFAAADVDHVWIGGRHGDGADRAGGLVVEEGEPDTPGVGALPHAAVVDADVEDVRLRRNAHRGHGSAAAERADVAPAACIAEIGIDLRAER